MSKVYLRAIELEDYKTSIKWRRDDAIWNLVGGTKYYVSESYEKQWVENIVKGTADIKLAVCTVEENVYIGNVYLTDIDLQTRQGESHVIIGEREYWGKGYAKEALELLLKYAFEERNFHRVTAKILDSNIASQKLYSKLGFTQEGLLRESVFKNGTYKNQYIYSLLQREHFEKLK